MPHAFSRLAVLALLCAVSQAQPAPTWRLTRSPHFEVYSQAPDGAARSVLMWFEQLRAFFQQQTGVSLDGSLPVRVIMFGSAKEYAPYRLGAASDAYYVGGGSRDYIVMVTPEAGEFHVAAHEYAHLVLRASGLAHPLWLNEGLAEFFSTVRIGGGGSKLGGALPANSQILRRREWMPLPELLAFDAEASLRENRDVASLFYAQSWALTEMLALSADYAPRFHALIASLTFGTPGLQAFARVYGKTPDAVARDVRAWVDARARFTPVSLPGVVADAVPVEVSETAGFASRSLLAELVSASGDLGRAEALYRDLRREAPENAEVSAALGAIALRKHDYTGARQEWRRAIEQGVSDPTLCDNYATLAGAAGLPADEIRPALERAIALRPDFDDARYSLALLEKSVGHYDAALGHLRAMRNIAPARAYSYWMALADAANELGRREEAIAAAQHATEHATTAPERAHASQLAYMARTDLAVGFTRDANGRSQLATTRVPHNTEDWNPFIEPDDDIRRVEGTLRRIDCEGDMTRIQVETRAGVLTLVIPDRSRVQMRNAPPEFTCGPQSATLVTAEYAVSRTLGKKVDGVVRGLRFR